MKTSLLQKKNLSSWLSLALLAGSIGFLSADLPKQEPVVVGKGKHRYSWIQDWLKLPEGMKLGNTHGSIVVDKKGRVLVNTDAAHAVVILDADGNYLKSWGKEFQGGLHGMCLFEEDGQERLLLAHIGRHEVIKTDLDGKVLRRWGYPEESGHYANAGEYRPTAVAVAPDGSFFVADGYGKSWVHQYDSEGNYQKSFGGPGTEPGKMRTPHGLWLDTRRNPPVLLVADRENHRLQYFSLDGEYKGLVGEHFRRPCGTYQHGTEMVVADLAGRVTLLDSKDQLIAHLGDQPDPKLRARNGIPRDLWKDGFFLAPHSAAFDQNGNLYVMDWLSLGRISKLKRLH
ncbi:MAG: peptidase [Planctomycetota bacterium]|nr:MAG: peptidase [Planctomycetota bacterium]